MKKKYTYLLGVLVPFLIFVVIATMTFFNWLFWRLFLPSLQYWHILTFVIFAMAFCAWHSFCRAFRERYLVVRIIEQVVVIAFLILLILFITGQITQRN